MSKTPKDKHPSRKTEPKRVLEQREFRTYSKETKKLCLEIFTEMFEDVNNAFHKLYEVREATSMLEKKTIEMAEALIQARSKVFRTRGAISRMIEHFPEDLPADDNIEISQRFNEGKNVPTINEGEYVLKFYERGNVIGWGSDPNDTASFTPMTYRLLQIMWDAPNRFLSKADLRRYVQEDLEADSSAIRMNIKRARAELATVDFPYEIESVRGKGYKLTKKLQS